MSEAFCPNCEHRWTLTGDADAMYCPKCDFDAALARTRNCLLKVTLAAGRILVEDDPSGAIAELEESLKIARKILQDKALKPVAKPFTNHTRTTVVD